MKLFASIFSLTICTFLATNNIPIIVESRELAWSTIFNKINSFLIDATKLSAELGKELVTQDPIIISQAESEEETKITFSTSLTDSSTNIKKQELPLTFVLKIVNNQLMIQAESPFFKNLGLTCSAIISQGINSEGILKASFHFEAVEAKIKPFFNQMGPVTK